MTSLALNSDQIGKIGIGAIIALVVIGLLLSFVITAIVGRIVLLVLVVGLSVLVWQQRVTIQDHVKKCQRDMTFFGVHVQMPKDVVENCKKVTH